MIINQFQNSLITSEIALLPPKVGDRWAQSSASPRKFCIQ